MYNGFRLNRKQQAELSQKEVEDRSLRLQRSSSSKRNRLSAGYKSRVQRFMLDMLSDPIKISPGGEREREKEGGVFRLHGYRSEKERVEEEMSRNSGLDLEPSLAKPVLRQRVVEKEINPRMYFRHRTELERVCHATDFPNELKPERSKSEEKLRNSSLEKRNKSEIHTKSTLLANIFPSLHRKTHFKAVFSIMSKLPHSSLLSPEVAASRNSPIPPSLRGNTSLKEEDAPYIAREVLKDCEIVTKHHLKDFLRAKSGKLISNSTEAMRNSETKPTSKSKSAHRLSIYGS